MLQLARPLVRRAVRENLIATAVLVALPASSFANGNVLVVDGNGSGSFTTIQAAIDAAQDHDVLLVRGGGYPAFVVADKSLTIVADVGAQVTVSGGATVRDLAAARAAVLIGLVLGGDNATGVALQLADDAGPVRVEACQLLGGSTGTANGASLSNCADVSFSGCVLRGGLAALSGPVCARGGGTGLAVEGSAVALYGCSVRGGDGANGTCTSCGLFDGDARGHGAVVAQANLFLARTMFQGGDGGDAPLGSIWSAPAGGPAGDGIRAYGTIRRLDSTASAGTPGYAILPSCGGDAGSQGDYGNAWVGGVYVDVAGSARGLSSSPLALAGTLESITVRGEPGDRVGLFLAPTTRASYVPAWHGMLFVPLRTAPRAMQSVVIGTIPASGVLEFALAIPPLAPGAASRTTFLQALFLDAQGQRILSGAHCMTTLP